MTFFNSFSFVEEVFTTTRKNLQFKWNGLLITSQATKEEERNGKFLFGRKKRENQMDLSVLYWFIFYGRGLFVQYYPNAWHQWRYVTQQIIIERVWSHYDTFLYNKVRSPPYCCAVLSACLCNTNILIMYTICFNRIT